MSRLSDMQPIDDKSPDTDLLQMKYAGPQVNFLSEADVRRIVREEIDKDTEALQTPDGRIKRVKVFEMNAGRCGMKVIVTEKFITKGQAYRGGWLPRQFEILGFGNPPPPGWRRIAVGREIAVDEAEEFLYLKANKDHAM